MTEEREMVARWMLEHSFATGHGDTLEDLLSELSWQIKELRDAKDNERRRCLDLVHSYYLTGLSDNERRVADSLVIAIRAAIRDNEKEQEPRR